MAGRRRSLAQHLLGWALGALTGVWLAFVVIGFETGQHEADELTDGHLASVAALLLSQTEIHFADARAVFPPGGPADGLRAHDYQQSLSVLVWDVQGRLLARTGGAPLPAFEGSEGFASRPLGTPPAEWRTYARWDPAHQRRVMVLLSEAERDDLAWDIGTQVAEPGLWTLPVVALVLGLAIRRGLRPLQTLSAEVHALDVQQAQPLPPRPRHREFEAIVEAIDTLVARYHAALAREQQLASEMAHELRTPLASLNLHARSLQGELEAGDRQAALQRIEQDALRAGQLVTHLLALARASRVQLAEMARPVDLAALARRVVADYGQAALDSGHELGLEAPDSCWRPGHAVLLEMALRNLLDNALAHTPPGTVVEVQLQARGDWLQVSDDGALRQAAGPGAAGGPSGSAQQGALASAKVAAPVPGRSPPGVLGLGLGHRVVDKVAAVHGGHFGPVPPPAGFGTCYRLSFGPT